MEELKFDTEVKMGCNAIVKINVPLLQGLADAGAIVMYNSGNDFWIMTGVGQLWLKTEEKGIHLECIAVYFEDRRQGKGGELMKILTEIADETNTHLSLRVSVVKNTTMRMGHPVVGIGEKTKNKIPVGSLPKWYQKFGFVKSEGYTVKKRIMHREPKK